MRISFRALSGRIFRVKPTRRILPTGRNSEVHHKMSQSSLDPAILLAAFTFVVGLAVAALIQFVVKLGSRLASNSSATKTSTNDSRGPFVYVNHMPNDPPLKNKSICVLLVDPQTDFCDPSGSLFVKGADEDMTRFSAAFEKIGLAKVGDVFVTLDTHQRYHIAHSLFWVNTAGEHPTPFTPISSSLVRQGIWKATRSEHQKWAEQYVAALEKKGKFTLVIWPDHCLVGTKGHTVYPPVQAVLEKWERKNTRAVNYVLKGNNAFTEHYSGLRAEVERDDDPKTQLNQDLIARLSSFDRIVVAGEAKSHCVNFTVRDLVQVLPEKQRGKVWLCKDAMASVTGFEKEGEAFFDDIKKLGVRLVKSSEAFM